MERRPDPTLDIVFRIGGFILSVLFLGAMCQMAIVFLHYWYLVLGTMATFLLLSVLLALIGGLRRKT